MTQLLPALRALRRDPLFALLAIGILAVGIAANVSVFTVVNSVLLKPIPYPAGDRMERIRIGLPGILAGWYPFSIPDIGFLRENNRIFERVAGTYLTDTDLSGGITPIRVEGARMEAEMWPMVGTAMSLGRAYTVDEDRRGDAVLVISHGLWRRVFGGDPNILGRRIEVDRKAYSIIGVLPREFTFRPIGESREHEADVFFPASFTKAELSNIADNYNWTVLATRKPGVSNEQVTQELERMAGAILSHYPAAFPGKKLALLTTPLKELAVGKVEVLLWLLLASVGAVFLIGCANIGSLLVARNLARQQEYAVRKALGATSSDLFRASLLEGLLLAIPGVAIGMALAMAGVNALLRLAPPQLPRLNEITMEPLVALFAMALAGGAAVFFSVFPVWQASRTELGAGSSAAFRSGSKGGTATREAMRLGGLLVTVEVALCLALVGATGLLGRTYWNLLAADPGFRPAQIVAFEIVPAEAAYPKPTDRKQFFDRLDAKLAEQPALSELAFASSSPLSSSWFRLFMLEGQRDLSGKKPQMTQHTIISPNYFDLMGVRLIAGRGFTPADREGAQPVVVINETLAKQFFPGGNPLGKRVRFGPPDGKEPLETIVGVVADTARSSLKEDPMPQTYQSFLQVPVGARTYFVKSASGAGVVGSSVLRKVAALDPNQVVARFRTLREVMDRQAALGRFQMTLLGIFGGVALLLAVSGIFGVLAHQVNRQVREIGIRMALGADGRATLGLVLVQGLKPVVAGIALGLGLLWAAQKSLESLLFGVKPDDAKTIGAAVGLLLLAALAAATIPAWRAVRLEPAKALRAD